MILSFQRNKFKVLPMVLSLILVSLIFLPVKSCKKEEPEEPIYTKLARIGSGFDADTTKKPSVPLQTKIVSHNFNLQGSDTLFRFLIFALQKPDDVTKNQLSTLLNWIQTAKQDTTRK